MGHFPNRWRVFDYLRVGLQGMPTRSLGGIDVTYRCNLRCRHCYFIKQNYREELSTEEWTAKFESLKKEGFPFYICGWIGGEPLLRKDLIEKGRRYFKSNVVFTNGTIELPDWPDLTFSVSIHGTEPYYYRMTGAARGTYERVKEYANRPDLKVIVACCVTRLNFSCIGEMVEEWSRTAVKGIVFEFYTPMRGEGDRLWLRPQERDRIIAQLESLRKLYGAFIWISPRIYRLMRSDRAAQITTNCPFPKIGFSFDPMGRSKIPCQLGPLADCERCGCILPFFSMLLTHRTLMVPEFSARVSRRFKHR
ncbi:MAG: radical SAM protein [Deltaproteobacteria bacterium]|nr:radical SAM protein [Deltaproteobacteria bacterium]MBW2152269.1 radical SAM protein [Deltaproteobacteria bacterium]